MVAGRLGAADDTPGAVLELESDLPDLSTFPSRKIACAGAIENVETSATATRPFRLLRVVNKFGRPSSFMIPESLSQ